MATADAAATPAPYVMLSAIPSIPNSRRQCRGFLRQLDREGPVVGGAEFDATPRRDRFGGAQQLEHGFVCGKAGGKSLLGGNSHTPGSRDLVNGNKRQPHRYPYRSSDSAISTTDSTSVPTQTRASLPVIATPQVPQTLAQPPHDLSRPMPLPHHHNHLAFHPHRAFSVSLTRNYKSRVSPR
jgi:hypothetical protein